MEVTVFEWGIFFALVLILLFIDLFVLHRKNKHITVKRAVLESMMWISVALLFGIWIYVKGGTDDAVSYYAAYAIEKAMSVDNLFVFILLFSMFAIPDEYQHKALYYGIIGAIVFRAIFVFIGSGLLETIDFMMYIFGIILVLFAFKTILKKDDEGESKIVKWLCKHINMSENLDGTKLFTVQNGVKIATPMLVCVIAIELTDIVFAIDSVPACLAITSDTFIVYTSNIFAVLGLRSLYFALRGCMCSLRYMKYGLGGILLFVGIKMLIADFYHVDVVTSLVVILGMILITVVASVMSNKGCQVDKPA